MLLIQFQNGWLLCDGSVVSRTTYSELFNAIGLSYVEEGYEWQDEERFPLPNGKGRTLVGKDSTDTDFNTLGKTGGEKTHKLTVDEMPSHKHSMNFGDSAGGDGSGFVYSSTSGNNNVFMLETGGGQAHNNLQPYLAENFIIKAKNTVVVKGDVIQETGTASETNVYSAKAIDNKLKTNIKTGQEVATNEYIDEKRVYYTRISINQYPGETAIINHNINNIDEIIDYDAIFTLSSGETRKMPGLWKNDYSSFMSTVYQVTKTTMQIVLGNFWTSGTFKKAVITIKYTKNT